MPLPILFSAASSFFLNLRSGLFTRVQCWRQTCTSRWFGKPQLKCWSGVPYYRSDSDCILSFFFPLCTTGSRFTVNTPGRCPSLAWTPVAPSASMPKDNTNLSRCAQKFSRFVNALARSSRMSVFFPLCFYFKGWNECRFTSRCLFLPQGSVCLCREVPHVCL